MNIKYDITEEFNVDDIHCVRENNDDIYKNYSLKERLEKYHKIALKVINEIKPNEIKNNLLLIILFVIPALFY